MSLTGDPIRMTGLPDDPATGAQSFAAHVVELYGPDLHWFLLSRLNNDQDAKDVAQEVYLRLLRLGKGELVRQPHAYVYFVACQVLAQFRLRAQQNLVTYDSKLAQHRDRHPDQVSRDAVMEPLMAQSEIERLLSILPATHRSVFVLRTFDGLSWDEIATRLSLSVHTVKKYLCEANARISVLNRER
jgi:RNA polymerase sigma factor (sigma-70 family)